ncbi:hypothetical protein ABZ070_25330 [Streptomyces sp. NPDC006283]|uniref:hypothetical protein n=1 Tax=Streptomyces sp. NPDC006283 TaxID=3156741 RepID=UPI0033AC1ACD
MHRLVREENPQSDCTETAKRYRDLAGHADRDADRDLTDFFVSTRALPVDAEEQAAVAVLHLPGPSVAPATPTD